MTKKNPHAVALGKRGGSVTSERKADASRLNGLRGGAPGWRVTSTRPAPHGIIYLCGHTSGSTPVEAWSRDNGTTDYIYAASAGDAIGVVPQKVRDAIAAAVRRYQRKHA